MKVKIPLTDQFLWALYDLIEGAKEVSDTIGPAGFRRILRPTDGFRRRMQKEHGRQRFAQLIYYLKKQGIIEAPSWKAKEGIIVTQKGMERISYAVARKKGFSPRRDGKCVMVIFDIPEKERTKRNAFRRYLKMLRYKQLQQSVWICPFHVLEQTQMFIAKFNLEDRVKVFIVEEP